MKWVVIVGDCYQWPLPWECTHICGGCSWMVSLACHAEDGVRFYLERECSATSGWINVGREWCCRGWSIEGGTPGGLFRTRDGLPRIRKARAARNVHECESVCAWNKNIVSEPKWLPCMNACMCVVFHYCPLQQNLGPTFWRITK